MGLPTDQRKHGLFCSCLNMQLDQQQSVWEAVPGMEIHYRHLLLLEDQVARSVGGRASKKSWQPSSLMLSETTRGMLVTLIPC